MQFYSSNGISPKVSLKEAVLQGLPEDNGLYMPTEISCLPQDFLRNLSDRSFQGIAFEVAQNLLKDALPENILKGIIESAITFDAPLVELKEHLYVLELFHGPTLAFKDFAARFMAKLMGYYIQSSDRPLFILTATSGDTGSAVANGFLNVEGIRVLVLYPSKKVSFIQEQQLTTCGANITALEINGTFDDCQRLVKQAFLDPQLRNKFFMTSANSINIARLIPQTFYYVYAVAQLRQKTHPVIFSVPSGNYGNLTAGLLAKRMGLPVEKFVAAGNMNNVIPRYLENGIFVPQESQTTLSNAMDVGDPSNFSRMLALYDHDVTRMRQDITAYNYSDSQTVAAMQEVLGEYGYVMDPHGAVGYLGLQEYLKKHSAIQPAGKSSAVEGIFFETAHPAKFLEVVEKNMAVKVELPERLKVALSRKKQAVKLSNQFEVFKSFMLNLNI